MRQDLKLLSPSAKPFLSIPRESSDIASAKGMLAVCAVAGIVANANFDDAWRREQNSGLACTGHRLKSTTQVHAQQHVFQGHSQGVPMNIT